MVFIYSPLAIPLALIRGVGTVVLKKFHRLQTDEPYRPYKAVMLPCLVPCGPPLE